MSRGELTDGLAERLSGWWPEYVGEAEGFECGCNEDGTGHPAGLSTVLEASRHLAVHVLEHSPVAEELSRLEDAEQELASRVASIRKLVTEWARPPWVSAYEKSLCLQILTVLDQKEIKP